MAYIKCDKHSTISYCVIHARCRFKVSSATKLTSSEFNFMSTEKLLALYPFDPPPPRRTYPSPHGPLTSAHPHASENIRFAFGIIQIFIWSMCPLVRVCVFVPNILVVAECDLKRFLYFWLSLWVINL